MCRVYKLYSPDQGRFTSSFPSGTTGQSRGWDLMRQTLLLARGLVRWSKPLCQDASLNPLLLLSIWLPVWLLHARMTPTCPSLFVCLSWELSDVGPNHTTICPLPGSCPQKHGSSKCYSTVNLSRATGTPALWHTPVLSQRREEGEFGGNCTVWAIPSMGVLKASERAGHGVRGPEFICCRNTWTCGQTPPPGLYQAAETFIMSCHFNLLFISSPMGVAFISYSY